MPIKSIIVLFFLSATLVTGGLSQQEILRDDTYFQYEKGVMFKYSEKGKEKVTRNEYISNGMRVFPDGSYTRLNEKKKQLKNGQYLDMNGKIYNDLAALQAQLEAHRAAVKSEYYRLCNGEVVRHHNKTTEKIKDGVNLNHGIILYPDGSFTDAAGKKFRLREGQCMDLGGKVFKNSEALHLECEQRIKGGKN